MHKILSFFIVLLLLMGLAPPAISVNAGAQAGNVTWEEAKNASLDWISNAAPNPAVGHVGGEWSVIALARAGRITLDDPLARAYLRDLNRTIREVNRLKQSGNNIQHPPTTGTFPGAMRRWTDFQRVTLAVTSLGLDASNHNGDDLTEIFRTFVPVSVRHGLNQGINADIFALIALDSNGYGGGRERFVRSILNAQRNNGTWGLGAVPMPADLDTTAMAIQALAPYYAGNPNVTAAVDRALTWLRGQQFTDVEGTAQMIVALAALGPDFADEANYYVNLLLTWHDPRSGGFIRPVLGSRADMMATEQGAYALVAYYRLVNGLLPLYDMRDAFEG